MQGRFGGGMERIIPEQCHLPDYLCFKKVIKCSFLLFLFQRNLLARKYLGILVRTVITRAATKNMYGVVNNSIRIEASENQLKYVPFNKSHRQNAKESHKMKVK